MENLNATPAVEQSEPVSQAATAAATSVVPVASTDENAKAEAAELLQSDASAPATEYLSIYILQDDNSEAHEHELARMVDEGGPCPERTLKPGAENFYRALRGEAAIEDVFYRRGNRVVADHPFKSFPTSGDPFAQICHVEGCKFSDSGHPGLSEEAKGQLRTIVDEFENVAAEAEVKGDTQSFEERLAKVEEDLAQLRKITEHHGLRGPQA
jgi:hypothetical protein